MNVVIGILLTLTAGWLILLAVYVWAMWGEPEQESTE